MKKNLKKGFTLIELLVVIAIIGILSGIVLASLNTARDKGNDAKTQGQLSGMRSAMETYYATASNYGTTSATDGCTTTPSVAPWNDTESGMANLADQDNFPTGTAATLVCYTLGSAWAASARLDGGTGDWYCVDSGGTSKNVGTAATISGTDVVC